MVTRPKTWEVEAEKSRKILDDSIQKQWLLPQEKLPASDRVNVLDVPKESGLLSQRELDITGSDATGLVEKMGAGEWTAEEVTIAFLKRATIGHQLVSLIVYQYYPDDFQLTFLVAEHGNGVHG